MKNSLYNKIERLLNHVINQDPYALEQLSRLTGKRLQIDFSELALSVSIDITDEGFILNQNSSNKTDVLIRGNAPALIGLIIRRKSSGKVFPGDIEIKGDMHLAQDIQLVLKNIDIDWEEYASHWIGDAAARKLGNITRESRKWLLSARDNLTADFSEYLRFEVEILPDHLLVNEFNRTVDVLRDDTERLQQRITYLRKQLKRKTH